MVGIYIFLAQTFANTTTSGLSYAIKYPLIQHRSQPIQISLTISNNSPDVQPVTDDILNQLYQITLNEKSISPNNKPYHPANLQPHQEYSLNMTYSLLPSVSDKVTIKHIMDEVRSDTSWKEIQIINDVSSTPYWKESDGTYYIFAPNGRLLRQIDTEPQHITFGYNVLGIQTKTSFEGCLIDQSIKCNQLTRPAEGFLLLDGNILYDNAPSLVIKQHSKVSLLVFATPIPYFVPMTSYIPQKALSLENQGNLFWIFYGMKGLDIIRPSRSNDAKHPMSGTRLMKDNILYANIIRDENLLLEVVYMLDDDIKYQRLTLHGKPFFEQNLIKSTAMPTDVNVEKGRVHLKLPDQSTHEIELQKGE